MLLRRFAGHEQDDPPSGHSMNRLKALWPECHKNMSAANLRQQLSSVSVIRVADAATELRLLLKAIGLVRDET